MPGEKERLNQEDAQNEADILLQKIDGGQAKDYADAERQIEQEKSEKVAQEKKEILLGEKFAEFAVRFMSFDEYLEFVDHGISGRGCSLSFAVEGGKAPIFKDWLGNSKKDWYKAMGPTEWDIFSGKTVENYQALLEKLKEAHNEAAEALQGSEGERDIKGETVRRFMQKVDPSTQRQKEKLIYGDELGYLPFREKNYENAYRKVSGRRKPTEFLNRISSEHNINEKQSDQISKWIDQNVQLTGAQLKKISDWRLEKLVAELIPLAQNLFEELGVEDKTGWLREIFLTLVLCAKRGGPEYDLEKKVDFIEAMRKNPELLSREDNLRKFFSLVPYLEGEAARNRRESDKYAAVRTPNQYEIALILHLDQTIEDDLNHLEDGRSKRGYEPYKYYRVFKYDDGGGFKYEDVLGAVVITPDRILVEKAVEHSEKAGKVAHPVFTSSGRVAYPK